MLFLNRIRLTIDRDDGDGNGGNVDMILCTAQGAQVEGGVDPTGGNDISW